MPRKIRQLKADLRRAGAHQVAQESSHTKWKHPLVPGALVELSGDDGDDANAAIPRPDHRENRAARRARENVTLSRIEGDV